MRFVFAILLLWSSSKAMALDHRMTFDVKQLSDQVWDYSAVWNETTQSMTYQIGLVPRAMETDVGDVALSMGAAKQAQVVLLDTPDLMNDCQVLTQWQFEYQKGLPEYLLYLTLQGEGCKKVNLNGLSSAVRVRFEGVPVPGQDPQDFAIEYNVH